MNFDLVLSLDDVQGASGSALAAPTATGTMTGTNLKDGQVNQRDFTTLGVLGRGYGTIPVRFSAVTTGTLSVRISSGGATRGDFQAEYQFTVTAGGSNIDVPIPSIGARNEAFEIDIMGADLVWQNGAVLVFMGDVGLGWGQSEMATAIKSYTDVTTLAGLTPPLVPHASTRVYGTYQTPGLLYQPAIGSVAWEIPAVGGHYDSAGIVTLLNRRQVALQVAQGFVVHAVTSTELSYWQLGWTGYTQLALVIANCMGSASAAKFSYHVLDHGHASANITLPAETYKSDVITDLNTVKALNHYAGTVTELVTPIPNVHSNGFGPMRVLNDQRKGMHDAAITRPAGIFATVIDMDETDSIHGTQAGNVNKWSGIYRSLQGIAGGPVLVSAQRLTNTTTELTFSMPSGTLVGTGAWKDRVLLYVEGSTQNKWVVSAGVISVSAAPSPKIVVTHPDPGVGSSFGCMWAPAYDGDLSGVPSPNMLRNDVVDGDGILFGRHAEPNLVPIIAAAITPGGATNTPGGAVGPSSMFDMSGTGVTYGASILAGFGQCMTAGVAVMQNLNHGPVLFPGSMTGYFLGPSAVSANAVIDSVGANTFVGLASTKKFLIGYTKVNNGFGGGNGSFAFATAVLYQYCHVWGPNGIRTYYRDVTNSGPVILDINISAALLALHSCVGNWQIGEATGASKFFTNSTGSAIFELAKWNVALDAGGTWNPITTPLVGNEAGLVSLQKLDGNLIDTVRFA